MKLNLKRIRLEMKRQKLSQAGLARIMGAKEQWVSAILKGRAGRTFYTVWAIAQALNVREKEIVEEE